MGDACAGYFMSSLTWGRRPLVISFNFHYADGSLTIISSTPCPPLCHPVTKSFKTLALLRSTENSGTRLENLFPPNACDNLAS